MSRIHRRNPGHGRRRAERGRRIPRISWPAPETVRARADLMDMDDAWLIAAKVLGIPLGLPVVSQAGFSTSRSAASLELYNQALADALGVTAVLAGVSGG